MTNLQLEANKARETERANRAKEAETHRSNLAQERKIDSEIFKNKATALEKGFKAGKHAVDSFDTIGMHNAKKENVKSQTFKNWMGGISGLLSL